MRTDTTHLYLSLLVVFIALALGACGTGGYLVTQDQLGQIQIGTSTKHDVQELLGSPKTIIPSDSATHVSETWSYTYAKYPSDPYTGVPPIGMTSVPISRNRRRTPEINILFNQSEVVTGIQEKSMP